MDIRCVHTRPTLTASVPQKCCSHALLMQRRRLSTAGQRQRSMGGTFPEDYAFLPTWPQTAHSTAWYFSSSDSAPSAGCSSSSRRRRRLPLPAGRGFTTLPMSTL